MTINVQFLAITLFCLVGQIWQKLDSGSKIGWMYGKRRIIYKQIFRQMEVFVESCGMFMASCQMLQMKLRSKMF